MEDPKMMRRKTRFGSLEHYEKGGVEVINDDPRNYAFSNIFEVASKSEPYEKVAVGKNLKYVLEAIRAEGTSPWYTASHDESAIIMDGEVEIVQQDQLRPGFQCRAQLVEIFHLHLQHRVA